MNVSNHSLLSFLSSFLILKVSAINETISGESHFVNHDPQKWKGDKIKCIDNVDCIVDCFAKHACSTGTKIIGPSNAKLTINCNSGKWRACHDIFIYAQHSTELHINVYNKEDEFRSVDIYTPNNPQSPIINTFITCGIIGEDNDNSIIYNSCTIDNNIYSVNGWQSVHWTYAGEAFWSLTSTSYYATHHPNVMHCGLDYNQSCSDFELDGRYYRCPTESQCGTAGSALLTISAPSDAQSSSLVDIEGIIFSGCIALICFVIILVILYLRQKRQKSTNDEHKKEVAAKSADCESAEENDKVSPTASADADGDSNVEIVFEDESNAPNTNNGGKNITSESVDNKPAISGGDGAMTGKGQSDAEDGESKIVKSDLEMNGRELLIHWHLGQFVQIMIDEKGWDDPMEWKYFTEESLKNDIGLRRVQVLKFMDRYKDWIRRKNCTV